MTDHVSEVLAEFPGEIACNSLCQSVNASRTLVLLVTPSGGRDWQTEGAQPAPSCPALGSLRRLQSVEQDCDAPDQGFPRLLEWPP